MEKCLIFETMNPIGGLERSILEGKGTDDGLMHLKGVLGVCGVRNNNQRVYETANYKKMVESMKERLKKGPILGEMEHPTTMNISLPDVSHRIDSIDINEETGVVSGEITLLDTPKGKIARAIVEGGGPLYISSRAQGTVDPKNGTVTLENLATYDLVGSPGFSQAEMKLNENQVAESICESIGYVFEKKENNKDNHMTNEELQALQESITALQEKVSYLTEQNKNLQEQIEERPVLNIESLSESIQKWVMEEYTPNAQKWIVEQYSGKVQQWVTEEFAGQVEKWVNEEYTPNLAEKVQKWVVEEFGSTIQGWVINECAPTIEKWLTEHRDAELKSELTESLKAQITESLKATKESKLANIDAILQMCESHQQGKPTFGRKGAQTTQPITENLNDQPAYIQGMPDDKRALWAQADANIRESIQRKARLYNWQQEGAIEKFWESIDFNQIKPAQKIFEDLTGMDSWEAQMRQQIRLNRIHK